MKDVGARIDVSMNKFQVTLKKYIDQFHGQEGYFESDIRNLELFKGTPFNINPDDVKTKVSVVDDREAVQHELNDELVRHIVALNIDPRLKAGDLMLVEDMANMEAYGRHYHLLTFASSYCNFHRPDVYPVYSVEFVDFYREYIIVHGLGLDPDKLNTYPVFCAVLEDFINRLGLKGKMDYLHIRKFLWLFGSMILKESGS